MDDYPEAYRSESRPPDRQPTGNRIGFIWPMVLMGLFGFLIARWIPQRQVLRDPNAAPRPITARGDLAESEKSTIELFRANAPSVVFITTTQVQVGVFSNRESSGAGSGFVWDEKGHIVTNYHVIAQANRATAILPDQTNWQARVVGVAPGKDLAVLSIDAPADKLRPINLGKSEDLQIGQSVFAIGNPFGLDFTLTTGVISALDRQIPTEAVDTKRLISGAIQTDAAINPGNSGGPLLDSAGSLIGVNTAIYSPSGAYAGVGFAIPVDTVNRVVPQLIKYGKIVRPSIGISPFTRNDRFASQVLRGGKLPGVLIQTVEPGSSAERAGLKGTQFFQRGFEILLEYGDLIVQADDREIKNLDDWYSFLESHQPGDRVQLTVLRNPMSRNREQLITRIVLEQAL